MYMNDQERAKLRKKVMSIVAPYKHGALSFNDFHILVSNLCTFIAGCIELQELEIKELERQLEEKGVHRCLKE